LAHAAAELRRYGVRAASPERRCRRGRSGSRRLAAILVGIAVLAAGATWLGGFAVAGNDAGEKDRIQRLAWKLLSSRRR
jgi:hypothetical protein